MFSLTTSKYLIIKLHLLTYFYQMNHWFKINIYVGSFFAIPMYGNLFQHFSKWKMNVPLRKRNLYFFVELNKKKLWLYPEWKIVLDNFIKIWDAKTFDHDERWNNFLSFKHVSERILINLSFWQQSGNVFHVFMYRSLIMINVTNSKLYIFLNSPRHLW